MVRKLRTLVLVLVLASMSPALEAGTCDKLQGLIADVNRQIKKCNQASSLETAKPAARDLANALSGCATALVDCGAADVSSDFREAADQARKAADAESGGVYVAAMRRTLLACRLGSDKARLNH